MIVKDRVVDNIMKKKFLLAVQHALRSLQKK
jgi:hypothetical protein